MNLSVTLNEDKSVVIAPVQTSTIPSGTLEIERIIDVPSKREVIVIVNHIGRILLEDLSGDNYDTPAEWTNADIQNSLLNWINSNS
jgi:hypothetical protein